jgi:hypothetical protein
MNLYEMIMEEFPELTDDDFNIKSGFILLRNDGDGDYIAKWEYSKPLPKGMKIGK